MIDLIQGVKACRRGANPAKDPIPIFTCSDILLVILNLTIKAWHQASPGTEPMQVMWFGGKLGNLKPGSGNLAWGPP